jgi:hypothetical protein
LFDVNLEYSTFDTVEDLIDALSSRLSREGYLGVREFHEIAAEICLSPIAEWGDKTPDYGFHMRLLQRLWPTCKFLHVVRNGLDTARSMSEHSGCRLMAVAGYDNWCSLSYDRLYEKYERKEVPLEAHVASWRRRLARIRAEAEALESGTYMEIRYEDVLVRTHEVLEAVAGWLELTPDPAWSSEAAQLPRPPRPWGDPPIELALRLLPDDLRALNQEGGRDFRKVSIPFDRDDLLQFLHGLRPSLESSRDERLKAASASLAVFSSHSVCSDVEIATTALSVLLPAVREELGEEGVGRWKAWFEDMRAAIERRTRFSTSVNSLSDPGRAIGGS